MSEESLQFEVHRTIRIEAPPEVVFDFFADPALFATWFGPGSSLDLREGGELHVAFPGGASAVGEVLAFERPNWIRFTWGYPRDNSPVPPGGSVVEVKLETIGDATEVVLRHKLSTDDAARAHEGGWAYHLSRLASKAARERLRDTAPRALEAWFAAWSSQGDEIEAHLSSAMVEDGSFTDDAVSAPSRAEVAAHIARCHAQMPGFALRRAGPILQTADRVSCRTALEGPNGTVGHALLVCRMAQDGRIAEATGFFEDAIPGVSDGPMAPALDSPADGESPAAATRTPDVEPHLWCTDLAASREFYEQALGFETFASFPPGDAPTWFQLARGSTRLMLARNPEQIPDHQSYLGDVAGRLGKGGAVSLYVHVDDVDALHTRAAQAGAAIVEAPWNPPWGGRQFTVQDPDGNWWTCCGA